MNRKILNVFSIALMCAVVACNPPQPEVQERADTSVDSLFDSYHLFKMRINPIEATKAGELGYNHLVANYISDEYQQDLIDNYTRFLGELDTYDSSKVSPQDWLSMKVMEWDCRIKLEGLSNEIVSIASPMYNLPNFELMPIIQIQSLHLYFSQLAGGTSVQPFKTSEDYDNWLNRVDGYLEFLDTCILKMEEGMATNVVLPKSLIQKVIPQLESFIVAPIPQHLFFKPITLIPDDFSTVEKERLELEYRQMISDKLIPKYKVLKDFLETSYLSAGLETSGIGALPNGLKTYEYLIRLHTTTDMTVDEIHELGISEVSRISVEMEKAMADLGFEGDLKQFLDYVRSDEEQMPFTDPEEVIANFNSINDRIVLTLDRLFDLEPKASFVVKRTEAFREASASAEYVPGSKDGARAGVFYVPIPDVTKYNKYSDEALFLHEAIPGHHYQLSLQQENKDLPKFLHPESMGVFVEGWALYAESLGVELGLYEDPIQYFGMLSMEMHRAIRLVVDTGLHGKGWTREQAIQYSLDHEAESEASIISEIERYMATPGQALSYKIGQLKIQELRERAEEALGESFDIREYHDQVLNSGSLPMVLLESKINDWIKSKL